ncbi:hypothetical protein ABID59_004240 [Bradyrhizobium sp. S3.3.6]
MLESVFVRRWHIVWPRKAIVMDVYDMCVREITTCYGSNVALVVLIRCLLT